MRLLPTGIELIRSVADQWKGQYCHRGEWTTTRSGDSRLVYERLRALPETATAADADAIIGNDGWTRNACSDCGARHSIVQIGQDESDYDCRYSYLCADCVVRLQALVDGLALPVR